MPTLEELGNVAPGTVAAARLGAGVDAGLEALREAAAQALRPAQEATARLLADAVPKMERPDYWRAAAVAGMGGPLEATEEDDPGPVPLTEETRELIAVSRWLRVAPWDLLNHAEWVPVAVALMDEEQEARKRRASGE